MKYENFPFSDCAEAAMELVSGGIDIYQKFTCASCGARLIVMKKNKFYTRGLCGECGAETNIVKDGCNYMTIWEE